MSDVPEYIKVYAEYTDREGNEWKRILGIAPAERLDYWHATGILNRLNEIHFETYRADKQEEA